MVRLNPVFNYIFPKQISPSFQLIRIISKIKSKIEKKMGSINGSCIRLFFGLARGRNNYINNHSPALTAHVSSLFLPSFPTEQGQRKSRSQKGPTAWCDLTQ